MKKLFATSLLAAATFATTAFAVPNNLVVVNDVGVQSNAFVRGVATSSPIAAHTIASIPWTTVTNLCNDTMAATNVCAIEIYAETDTATPVDVGTVVIYVDTGTLVALNRYNIPYQLQVTDAGRITLKNT